MNAGLHGEYSLLHCIALLLHIAFSACCLFGKLFLSVAVTLSGHTM